MILRKPLLCLILLFSRAVLFASDAVPADGFIRLILNQRTGSFSLLYLTDPKGMKYEPMFYNNDPSSTFLSVNADGNVYKMGQSKEFETRLERQNGQPAIIFESSFMQVTQVFTPVQTPNSPNANGVKVTVNIQNKGRRHSFIGLKMLIDTHLGEKRGRVPFITNSQLITKEKLIEGSSGELFWLSRGQNLSLMGSIVIPGDTSSKTPDFVHIANWKRLSDAFWDLKNLDGRSFSYLPYSVGDSAVCYYYEPALIEGGGTLTYSILLTTEDIAWYNPDHPLIGIKWGRERPRMMTETVPEKEPAPTVTPAVTPVVPAVIPEPAAPVVLPVAPVTPVPPVAPVAPVTPVAPEPVAVPPSPVTPSPEPVLQTDSHIVPEPLPAVINTDLMELYELQETLNRFISGEIYLSEEDLLEIEGSINRLKAGHR